MKKRIFSLIMVICMLSGIITALPASAATSGQCGDNVYWTLDDNGTLTISGTGDMWDWSEESPWHSSRDSILNVVIDNGVTSIGDHVFDDCNSLTSINIPNSVISIGNGAFFSCSSLANISIPNSVTSIGDNAFYNCSSITSIIIPDSVTDIGNYAFGYCQSLTSINVDINNNYYSSDNMGVLFNKNKSTLIRYPGGKTEADYTIPNGVTFIGNDTFSSCNSLTNISIPNSVTSIGDSAFRGCDSLTSINIPDSVKYIGNAAFAWCYALTSISIPNSVISIGDSAFRGCDSLTNINIPDSVEYIGNGAFDCQSLTSINVDINNNYYSSDNMGVLFNKNKSTLIRYPGGKTEADYTIPNGVTFIGNDAFNGCYDLKSISIPNSVTSIGDGAFCGCKYLAKISMSNSVVTIGDSAFYSCGSLKSISIPNSVTDIGNYAFRYCQSLTGIRIPNSVTKIGVEAFAGCTDLKSINIPDSVISIGYCAFYGCGNLKSISIPNGVTHIDDGAFYECRSLTDVYYSGTESQWKMVSIGYFNNYLLNAKIHYNSTGPSSANYSIGAHLWLNGNCNREAYLTPGQGCSASIEAYPLEAYPTSGVTWHSTDTSVATVSQSGYIKAAAPGRANVYITTANGITSDILPVIVTDLSKLAPTASDKVKRIGFDSNYNWLIKSNNFIYWNAFINNDSNAAKYYFQNFLCAPLFDKGELKNLYSGVCSKERAKKILLSFVSETYENSYQNIKKDIFYKLGDKTQKYLGEYLDKKIDKGYGDKLKDLGEDKIQEIFSNCDLDTGIASLSGYLDPDNPKQASDLISSWIMTDTVGEMFSCVSKVVNIANDIGSISNEVMNLEAAAKTDEAYIDMLDYMANECIDRNVRAAAAEIKERMNRDVAQNFAMLSAELVAKKSMDKYTDKFLDNIFDKITGASLAAKIGREMGIFVSNEFLHASDYLQCGDNIRLISYISVAMTNKLSGLLMNFNISTDEVQKENYAQQLIEQYNLLIAARKLGEENYRTVYKYNPVNWAMIRQLFGMQYNDADAWYKGISTYLDNAKGNPEVKCTYKANMGSITSTALGLTKTEDISVQSTFGTPYTSEEFYALFSDKAFADAVLYSIGADPNQPDWNVVTKEAVEGLTALYCNEDGAVLDISGISNLKSLKYLNLSNQNVNSLPDEITQLSDLEFISLFNNGITVYPEILNDIPSLNRAVLSYNLLTDVSSVSDSITVELSGNLLDTSVYQKQRYLYSDMPIIYSADTDLTDVVKVKDMYGAVYDYNGESIQTEGNISDGSIVAAVNGSTNPNARITILADITDTTPYTAESFSKAFPDSNVRAGVLSALGTDEDTVDYSKITAASIAAIGECTIIGAADFTGVELLRGVNSLDLEQSDTAYIPSELEQLSNLRQLTLKGSSIASLSGLSRLKSLTQLDISQCTQLDAISELGNLTKLEKLYADGIGAADILDAVSSLTSLKTLSVLGNGITDISSILNNSYDYLNISGNLIAESVFESAEFIDLQNRCDMLVYSPQKNGLIKDIALDGNAVNITIENDTGTIYENICLYTAVYRSNVLIEVKKNDISQLSEYEKLTPDISLTKLENGDLVKCFIWAKNMQSVTLYKEITVSGTNE